MLRDPGRPNSTHRLCCCCCGGTGRSYCSGPRRSFHLRQKTLPLRALSWRCASQPPGGRASPTALTTAVMPPLFLPFALGQEGPSSPEETAISESVVAPCFAISRGRASPTDFAPVASTASAVAVALRGRPSATDLTSAAATAALVAPPSLDQDDQHQLLTWRYYLQSQEAELFHQIERLSQWRR